MKTKLLFLGLLLMSMFTYAQSINSPNIIGKLFIDINSNYYQITDNFVGNNHRVLCIPVGKIQVCNMDSGEYALARTVYYMYLKFSSAFVENNGDCCLQHSTCCWDCPINCSHYIIAEITLKNQNVLCYEGKIQDLFNGTAIDDTGILIPSNKIDKTVIFLFKRL